MFNQLKISQNGDRSEQPWPGTQYLELSNIHWVNSFFASSALCLHSNPVPCLTDAGLGMCTLHYNTLYNTNTYYIASLILVRQDLEIEESGQKGYSVRKNLFRKTAVMLPLMVPRWGHQGRIQPY